MCIIALSQRMTAEYRELYGNKATTNIWWQNALKSRIVTAEEKTDQGA